MAKVTSYMNSKKRRKGPNKGLLLVIVLIIIFVGLVIWFRSDSEEVEVAEEATPEMIGSTTPSGIQIEHVEVEMIPGMVDQIVLSDVSGGSGAGTATRQIEDGFFRHVAQGYMPVPREGYFYEGWLVRQSPFDFFSTGNMVQNESGEWVLEWFGEFGQDYADYPGVVITLEPDDGNPDPADHILEGEF